jgi:CMP-N-acetylneuraminate monooxygenase
MQKLLLSEIGAFEKLRFSRDQRSISLNGLASGVHEDDDVFFKISENSVDWVISRNCDHANGKLFLCADKTKARCPLHDWQLDTCSLKYTNVDIEKRVLPFSVKGKALLYEHEESYLTLPDGVLSQYSGAVKVRFISHACILIEIGEFRIVTDPWIVGPCFSTGWWHAFPPKEDAIEILQSADLIYISHNHPDHMHLETLGLVSREVPIIVPEFKTASVLKPLKDAGFKNIFPLPFNKLFAVEGTPIVLSILQAGDFRDDSGLYIAAGSFSALLTVDSNSLNSYVLPRNVDLLLCAFAGGASGFPLCFDVLSLEDRKKIVKRNKAGAISQVRKYLETVNPKYFMPYAGYFREAAERDRFILENNLKNKPADVQNLLERFYPGVRFIDPTVTDTVNFDTAGVEIFNSDRPLLYEINDAYIESYLNPARELAVDFSIEAVADYFKQSQFIDDLIVYLVPTDDLFNAGPHGLLVDFRGNSVEAEIYASDILIDMFNKGGGSSRHKLLKVRKEPLWQTIRLKLPWEDLSIGFQCRVDRKPNVYNSKFWYYFTNVYIGK